MWPMRDRPGGPFEVVRGSPGLRWTRQAAAVTSTPAQMCSTRTLGIRAMSYSIAVVGATGNVGREMLSILRERQFPVRELHALASRRSIGVEVSYGDDTLKCKDL